MKKTEIKFYCDLCGNEITEKPVSFSYPVVFTTEQNEGYPCKPYIQHSSLECCNNCATKILKVKAEGAQGYNKYEIYNFNQNL